MKSTIQHALYVLAATGVLFFGQKAISGQPLSLKDCLHRAFETSRILQMAELDTRLAEAKLGNSRAQKYPFLTVNGAYTRIGKVTSFTIPMGTGERTFQFGVPNRVNADVRLQLPLFTWGRIRSTLDIARFGINLSTVQQKQQRINTTDQVLRAYYALLLNQKVISVHEQNLSRAHRHLSTAVQRFQSGYVSSLDTLRARAQVQTARTTVADAGLNLVKSRIFLARLIATEAEDLGVSGEFSHRPISANEKEILQKAWAMRTELEVLGVQQNLAEENIRLARSLNKPNVAFFSGYNVQNGFDPMDPDKFVDNWNAGVQVIVPLFDGFASSYKMQEAQLQLSRARLQEEEVRELIRMQIRTALVGLQQSDVKIEAQEVNISLTREALQTAERQYQNGLISSLDVLDAQQALAQSELANLQLLFNHIMAKIEVCRAMGDFSWFESQ
ncbi:TolC family protein [candidate division KSB1 bacterium]|nr:TolC family protein [candidate division KSB1 bacterium]